MPLWIWILLLIAGLNGAFVAAVYVTYRNGGKWE